MDKLSIIIPVYNSEHYIGRCLDSVTAQTYGNLEILCIDDGSSDSSGSICSQYAKKDERIRVFHRAHAGVSAAKNFGLKQVTGQYTGFVDSDDWIEPEFYETLYQKVKANHVPIGITSYYKDDGQTSISAVNRMDIPDHIIPPDKMLLYPLQRDDYLGFCGYLWNKLFSTDIIQDQAVMFDDKIGYGEDVLFYTQAVLKGGCTGIYIERPLYHYYQHSVSITKSKSLRVKSDILAVYKKVETLLKEYGYIHLAFWARGFYCHHASVIAEIAWQDQDSHSLALMQNEIRLHLSDYIKTNEKFPEKFDRIYRLLALNPGGTSDG